MDIAGVKLGNPQLCFIFRFLFVLPEFLTFYGMRCLIPLVLGAPASFIKFVAETQLFLFVLWKFPDRILHISRHAVLISSSVSNTEKWRLLVVQYFLLSMTYGRPYNLERHNYSWVLPLPTSPHAYFTTRISDCSVEFYQRTLDWLADDEQWWVTTPQSLRPFCCSPCLVTVIGLRLFPFMFFFTQRWEGWVLKFKVKCGRSLYPIIVSLSLACLYSVKVA